MRQYITVQQNKDGLQAKIIQVEAGLFGESNHVEDEITGPNKLVRIYLESNYPGLIIEIGADLLDD